jgi:hypothetical protein
MKTSHLFTGILIPFLCAASFGCATASKHQASAILKSEFIYESAPFPSCHASTIV